MCIKWVLSLPCGVFEGHSNTAAESNLREAYEIKEFIILTGPRENGTVLLQSQAKSFKSPKFGLDRQEENKARTYRQVPLLRVIGGELVACGKHSFWVMNVTGSTWKEGKG